MKNFKIVGAIFVAGLLVFSGCGSSDNNKEEGGEYAGETAAQIKARYLEYIKATNKDLNLSNTTINTNLIALAECLYSKDKTLTRDDIIATFGSGVREEDLNATGINCSNVSIRKVGGTFTGSSLNVLYYSINNPVTDNEQLLAYDYDAGKSYVVNTNVILNKKKIFLHEGEKDGNKEKITGKRYGIYLDPNQNFEIRQHTVIKHGRPSTFTYKFFTDNALMKFDVKNPKSTSYIFKSSQIPSTLSGVTKLGKEYKVLENIVDPDNTYIGLTALESLADDIKGENEDNKTQVGLTVRVSDSKVIAGEPLVILKDSAMMGSGILVSFAPPHNPTSTTGAYELRKYDKTLATFIKIADGEFHYAAQNDTHIYLFKEGSNKIFAYQKDGGTDVTAVAGVTLAGNYDEDIHAKASRHGSSTKLIDGGSTVSGRKPHLWSGNDAYISFHYDLQADIGKAFVFGSFGAYKSVQVFKLTGTTGTKIMDNGDAHDDSATPTNEPNNGHINLIAVSGDKLYAERGWWDGNATLGGSCVKKYPMPTSDSTACFHVKYGWLDTGATASARDITVLEFDDGNASTDDRMQVNNLPYYVSRRIAPLANGDKLYISLFKGGRKSSGYIHKQYQFNLADASPVKSVIGRTYFVKTHQSDDGIFGGKVIAFSQTAQTIFDADTEVVLSSTASINGKPGFSISASTDGVPLAGVGNFAMLKNNVGNHAFEMFVVDTENGGFKYIDFAPYGGWLYE
jgi:hypothetical protein